MSKLGMRGRLLTNTALVGALYAIVIAASATAQTQTVSFDIPAEPLGNSLRDFARESGQQIIFTDDLVAGKSAPALHGSYAPDAALSVLLSGSGLVMAHSPSGSIMVRPKNAEAASNDGAALNVETVTVTGSLIRGAIPASPVSTITRQDIASSGYATVADVIKAMPQSFGGGQNITSGFSPVPNSGNNFGYASTANLRGLGSDATLTLVDGHRLSYGGINNGVDLSLIPTSAIDRVEILTDGASALYGSDAVAGVVNVKLRTDFDGVESSVRIGTTTDGGGSQTQFNLLAGTTWDSGHVVAAFENMTQDAIRSDQRTFSSGSESPTDIIPHQSKDGYFAAITQDITPDVSAFAEGLYSSLGTHDIQSFSGFTEDLESRTSNFSAVAGFRLALPFDWSGEVSVGAASDSNVFAVTSDIGDETFKIRNTIYNASVSATGTLLSLPSGDVQMAIGGDFRHEQLNAIYTSDFGNGRDVWDVYAELQVPLVLPDPSRKWLQRLDLSASGRYENYSDFGSTGTPKLGLVYVPLDDLRLRATWGRSFEAPPLQQVYGGYGAIAFPSAFFPDVPPATVLLSLSGANTSLKPETSSNWTGGFDYTPSYLQGLTLKFTAFGISYGQRIVQPFASLSGAFNDPALAAYVLKAPTLSQIQQAIAGGNQFINASGGSYANGVFSGGPVSVIYDDRYQNAQSQNATGFDLNVEYHLATDFGSVDFTSSSSWLRLTQRTTPLSPSTVLTGTVFYPARFRSRDGLLWSQGDTGFSAAAYINFTAPEVDNFASAFGGDPGATPIPVRSWTTVDAQIGYQFSDDSFLRGLRAALSVTNLFDQDPPAISAAATNQGSIGFDPTNANGIGRLVSLNITKSW